MGKLIKTFGAVEDDSAFGSPGIYGEEGICESVRISTGEYLGYFSHFDDMVFTTSWIEEDGRWNCYIDKVFDADFNELFSLEERRGEGIMGHDGGILHVGGDYLIFNRETVFHGSNPPEVRDNTPIQVIGPDGGRKGEIDPKRFPRQVMGVFGGEYLICGSAEPQDDPYYFWDEPKLSIWDVSGKMLMDNVRVISFDQYTADEEGGYGIMLSGDYLEDENGVCYDSKLKRIDKIPEGADENSFYTRYGRVYFDGLSFYDYERSVFSGIKDGEGNWLFRIYNPRFSSDNDPTGWGSAW